MMKTHGWLRSFGSAALGALGFLSFFALGAAIGPGLLPTNDSRTVAEFHKLFYFRAATTWNNTTWLGVPVEKCPMDLVTYQEILYESRPDLLVEAGTFKGGSALFFASVMDLLNHGRVITIDITDRGRPPHPRITYLRGFSTSPDIVATVKNAITPSERVMVVLDSDHSAENVRKELRTYGPLVTVGAYLVVEDTNINGHPVLTGYGPGPAEALEDFLKTDSGFVRDPSRERFLLTFNPGGFLKKTR